MDGADEEIKDASDVFAKMTLMKEKMELEKLRVDTNKIKINLISEIKNQIANIQDLRRSVTKAVYKGDTTSVIKDFMFDKLLEKVKSEGYERKK